MGYGEHSKALILASLPQWIADSLVLTAASCHWTAWRHNNTGRLHISFNAYQFFHRLGSCGGTSIPSPALAVTTTSGASVHIRSATSSLSPWLETEAVLLVKFFVGRSVVVRRLDFVALSSRETSRLSGASGCMVTRFAFHTNGNRRAREWSTRHHEI